MLNLEAVIERANRHGALEINADYGTVTVNGRAVCDCVHGGGGCLKIRARFGKGIKAILDIDEYGLLWEAEEIEEGEEAAQGERQGAGGGFWQGERTRS